MAFDAADLERELPGRCDRCKRKYLIGELEPVRGGDVSSPFCNVCPECLARHRASMLKILEASS